MTTSPGTIVVALGGNALSPPGRRVTIADQFSHTRQSLGAVVDLAREGWRISIVHGNGPQVGDELERNELALDRVEPLPLGILVAATAGWIGYMIQQSLNNALLKAGVERDVITLITQTEVDADDPLLRSATKPIGHVLDPEHLERLEKRGVPVKKDASGRWRRLAPSPVPRGVVEVEAVRQLVEEGKVVVAAGGGGPPVHYDPRLRWEGVEAVVDKDRTAAILANRLKADILLMLTDVDAVYRGWGTDSKAPIRRMSAQKARRLLDTEELGRGSMRPKVEAAVSFAEAGGGRAIIAHLTQGRMAVRGEAGTLITEERV